MPDRPGRLSSLVALVALVICAGVIGSASGQGQPKPGGTLIMVHNEPTAFNPVIEWGLPQLDRMVYIGLTDYDKDGNLIPGLAEKWDVAKDGLTYTFQLRRDVTWHDGKPFTSADVKFTIEKILDPKGTSWLKPALSQIAQVDAPDPYTAVFRLREPAPTLLYNLWNGVIPKHVWEKEDIGKSAFNITPVGTGPFKVVEWVKLDHVTFVANDKYFRGRPYLDRVIMKTIPDVSVALAALERGDVHYLPPYGIIGGAPYQQVKALESKSHLEVRVYETTQAQHLYMRVDKPPFDNLKVRQAVAHAINKKELSDRMTVGYGKPLDSRVPPIIRWAYNAEVPVYTHDVAEANRLLDEAGLKRGEGGVRFKTHIYATPGTRVIMSELLREQLRAVGISTDIITNEWNTYISMIRDKRTAEGLWTIYHPTYIPDPEILLWALWGRENKPGGRNYMLYTNPRMDSLIEKLVATTERGERGKLFREVQEIAARDVPTIPLYIQPNVDIWNKKFRGFQPLEYGGSTLFSLEKVWQEAP